MSNLAEIGPVALEKNIFKFQQFYFCYFISFSTWNYTRTFVWTNMNSIHPRILCVKVGWSCPKWNMKNILHGCNELCGMMKWNIKNKIEKNWKCSSPEGVFPLSQNSEFPQVNIFGYVGMVYRWGTKKINQPWPIVCFLQTT